MGVKINKKLALTIYCLTRQGERSIDFALSSAKQWNLLRQYYDHDRVMPLHDLLNELNQLHPHAPRSYAKDRFAEISFEWVVTYPFRYWINQWRNRWSFSGDRVSFFIDTISSLVLNLACEVQPARCLLVDLRMDLHLCQRIIEMKLVGVKRLKQAANIEYFCQADHTTSQSLSRLTRLAAG